MIQIKNIEIHIKDIQLIISKNIKQILKNNKLLLVESEVAEYIITNYFHQILIEENLNYKNIISRKNITESEIVDKDCILFTYRDLLSRDAKVQLALKNDSVTFKEIIKKDSIDMNVDENSIEKNIYIKTGKEKYVAISSNTKIIIIYSKLNPVFSKKMKNLLLKNNLIENITIDILKNDIEIISFR